jgi:hypothetical protein
MTFVSSRLRQRNAQKIGGSVNEKEPQCQAAAALFAGRRVLGNDGSLAELPFSKLLVSDRENKFQGQKNKSI